MDRCPAEHPGERCGSSRPVRRGARLGRGAYHQGLTLTFADSPLPADPHEEVCMTEDTPPLTYATETAEAAERMAETIGAHGADDLAALMRDLHRITHALAQATHSAVSGAADRPDDTGHNADDLAAAGVNDRGETAGDLVRELSSKVAGITLVKVADELAAVDQEMRKALILLGDSA